MASSLSRLKKVDGMEGSVQEQTGHGYRSRQMFRWDEGTFFEDAEHKNSPSEVLAMRRLFNYCSSVSLLRFGRGYIDGSFSGIFPGVSSRPPITVFSDGRLRLSFGNLCDEETSYICRDALADRLRESPLGGRIPFALRSQTVNLPARQWAEEVERVIGALEHMRSKAP